MQCIYTYHSGFVLASYQAIKEFFIANQYVTTAEQSIAIEELVENECTSLDEEIKAGDNRVLICA